MFDKDGHLSLSQKDFFDLLNQKNDDEIISDYLMAGTPRVFETYETYCAFTRNFGHALGVHGRSFIVRGSAHLGYSISPRPEKIWRALDGRAHIDGKLSDVDVAIVDADYFDRMDFEVRSWESRQHRPLPNSSAFKAADRWAGKPDRGAPALLGSAPASVGSAPGSIR